MKKTLLGFILLSLCYLTSCLKNDKSLNLTINESNQLKAEAKSWLMSNSKRLANGKVSFALTENRIAVGDLSWNAASIKRVGDATILKVPFVFRNSSYSKNARLLSPAGVTDLPMMVNLYFKMENEGRISSAVRISAFEKNTTTGTKEIYFSFYNTELENIAEKFFDSKGLTRISMRDALSTHNSSSQSNGDCEQLSYTQSFIVSCYPGEVNNVICSYKKRTVTRYRCYGEMGEGENEVIDWIDPGEPGGGWTEYEEEEEEFANQNIIDSLTGFPCAQNVLSQLPNLDGETKKSILDVFGNDEDVNIKFFANQSLRGSTTDGATVSTPPNNLIFQARVGLNPDVLDFGTREYMMAVFFHESLHAYIDFKYNQYLNGIIDSNTFKNEFPIFWRPNRIPESQIEKQHHEEMAARYVSKITAMLLTFSPGLSPEAANKIAWGGLENTTVWYMKSDFEKNSIRDFCEVARDVRHTSINTGNNYQSYNFTACP